MQILLVDDESELTEPLTLVLTREGCRVAVAHDGATGYELAAAGTYALLIINHSYRYTVSLRGDLDERWGIVAQDVQG